MVRKKRKKVVKLRGSHTHGFGSKKKHRGSGNKGGYGMAGTGKRADQKKPSIWKERYFGKRGFKSIKQKKKLFSKAVNIEFLNEKLPVLVEKGIAKKENDLYKINLKELGYNKLLSKGTPTVKYFIECEEATEKAIKKIEEKGGKVVAEIKKLDNLKESLNDEENLEENQ
ncbi:MAG: uL15 family ribosomal protein [Candidatus Woesearchaeota archaeon]